MSGHSSVWTTESRTSSDAGTGGGQGYDIKSFTVVADYSVFE